MKKTMEPAIISPTMRIQYYYKQDYTYPVYKNILLQKSTQTESVSFLGKEPLGISAASMFESPT